MGANYLETNSDKKDILVTNVHNHLQECSPVMVIIPTFAPQYSKIDSIHLK